MFYNNEEEIEEEFEGEDGEESGVFQNEEEEPPLLGLCGDVNEEALQSLSLGLLTLNGGRILHTEDAGLSDLADIEFFISSGGGSVGDMFAVYDLMQLVKKNRDIATFGYGKVASAAVPLLAGGTPGKRHIGKNTRLMLHHCSSNIGGSHPTARANFNELKKVEEMMVQLIAEHSNLSAGEIYNIFSKNTDEYFSAEEALEMGLVDKII